MREPEEQIEGLRLVQEQVPEAIFIISAKDIEYFATSLRLDWERQTVLKRRDFGQLILVVGYVDTAALRHKKVELVYASGDYDLWSSSGRSLLEPDLGFEDAVEALRKGDV